MSSWHLGDARISVSLNKYPLDNGEWHSIFFYRFDNYIRIKVDGGGGVRQAENRDSSFRVLEVDRDSLLVGAELEYGVQVTTDFIGKSLLSSRNRSCNYLHWMSHRVQVVKSQTR